MAEVVQFARVPPVLLARLADRPLVLSRQVATPTYETIRFFALARELERPPLVMTMPDDRFAPAVNAWKRRLVKLAVETRHQTRYATITPFQAAEKQAFRDLVCLDGRSFLDFHRDLLSSVLGQWASSAAVDATEFFRAGSARERYERFFSLFAGFGVLAESYISEGPERSFTEEVVLPAFEETIRRFGRPPAIVRLLPEADEANPHWDRYPGSVLAEALRAAGRPVAAAKLEP